MVNEFEMKDFNQKRNLKQSDEPTETGSSAGPRLNVDADQDQAITIWALGTAGLLFLLAIPMIFFPSFILYIGETSTQFRKQPTPLEAFLSLHGGILLATFALTLIFNIPSSLSISGIENQNSQGHPLIVSLTIASALVALLSFNDTSVGALSNLVFLGSAIIAGWGGWTILFGGTSYVSRKTGADKRTSRFLFGNKSAASVKKQEWKRQQD